MPIGQLHENLTGNHGAAKGQLTMSREQAAYFTWKHCQNSPAKRHEITKAGSFTYLLGLLDKGEERGKYYAVGAVLCLVRADRESLEVLAGHGRNIGILADLLLAAHDRSKIFAAECLKVIAGDPELLHKLTAVIPQLVRATRTREPRWADTGLVRATCADVIACLAEVRDLPESISRREEATSYLPMLRAEGVLEAMLPLLHDSDKAAQGHAARVVDALLRDDFEGLGPAVLQAEAPPGMMRAAEAAAKAKLSLSALAVASVLESRGGVESLSADTAQTGLSLTSQGANAGGGLPLESRRQLSTTHPISRGGGARGGYDGLRTLVEIIRRGDAGGKAAAAGCVAQLCTMGNHVLLEVHALGGVPALVALLSPPAADDTGGKKTKKKKKPPPLSPEVMRGIVNASGALRLLSFEDSVKPAIMACGAVNGLAALVEMKGKRWNLNMDSYNNAIGCLYNLAQDRRNTEALEAAGLPSHLVRPFPAAWMCDPDSEDEEVDEGSAVMAALPGLKHLDAHYGLPGDSLFPSGGVTFH